VYQVLQVNFESDESDAYTIHNNSDVKKTLINTNVGTTLGTCNQRPANCMSWSTRCSAIAERPRCRVHYSFRQK